MTSNEIRAPPSLTCSTHFSELVKCQWRYFRALNLFRLDTPGDRSATPKPSDPTRKIVLPSRSLTTDPQIFGQSNSAAAGSPAPNAADAFVESDALRDSRRCVAPRCAEHLPAQERGLHESVRLSIHRISSMCWGPLAMTMTDSSPRPSTVGPGRLPEYLFAKPPSSAIMLKSSPSNTVLRRSRRCLLRM